VRRVPVVISVGSEVMELLAVLRCVAHEHRDPCLPTPVQLRQRGNATDRVLGDIPSTVDPDCGEPVLEHGGAPVEVVGHDVRLLPRTCVTKVLVLHHRRSGTVPRNLGDLVSKPLDVVSGCVDNGRVGGR
jgi:hypothetical protein